MTHIEFFKLQAKNLLHDWNEYKANKLTKELKAKSKFFGHDLFKCTLLINEKEFPLARAQHYVAKLAGFSKWTELIKENEEGLLLARIIYEGLNCSHDIEIWETYLVNSIFYEVTRDKQIQLARRFFIRHEHDDKNISETSVDEVAYRSFKGPTLREYLKVRYGITKAEYAKKADWIKEELRKEHAEYHKEMQINFSKMIRISNMSKEELSDYEYQQEMKAEQETLYVLLREIGVPFDPFGSPLGIGDD